MMALRGCPQLPILQWAVQSLVVTWFTASAQLPTDFPHPRAVGMGMWAHGQLADDFLLPRGS